MKILAIRKYGDFDMPYETLYIGAEHSPEPSVVLVELESVNYPINIFSDDKEKIENVMLSILKRHGYHEFEPQTVTICD